jgi:hypothetical protein
MAVGQLLLLRPHRCKRLDRRQLLEPLLSLLCCCLLHTGQQVIAILADAPAQRLTFCLLLGQALVVDAFAIALTSH